MLWTLVGGRGTGRRSVLVWQGCPSAKAVAVLCSCVAVLVLSCSLMTMCLAVGSVASALLQY